MPILKFSDGKFLPMPIKGKRNMKNLHKQLYRYYTTHQSYDCFCYTVLYDHFFGDCRKIVNPTTNARCFNCIFYDIKPTPWEEIEERIKYAYKHYNKLLTTVQNEVKA